MASRSRGVTVRTSGTRLVGADEMRRKLDALQVGARDAILREGLEAGAEVLRAGAARRVSDHPQLAAAVATKITTTKDGRAVALVGIDKSFGPAGRRGFFVSLARWREFGTRAHKIAAGALVRQRRRRGETGPPRTRSTKRVLANALQVFGTRVKHPGTRARPFLRPTFVEDMPRALDAMARTITERLRVLTGAR